MVDKSEKEEQVEDNIDKVEDNNSTDNSDINDSVKKTGSSDGISDRVLFLAVIFITWIFVIGGMAYIYKEIKITPKDEGNSEVALDKIYERMAKIEEIQKINKNKPDVVQAMEFNRKTVNRLDKIERIVDNLPSEFPKPVKIPDNLVDQDELLAILTRVQKLEDDFSKREGSSKVEDYINPLLMGVMNLREHLMKGEPYEADITLLKAIGGNDEKIKAYIRKIEKILKEKIQSIDDLKDSFDKTAKEIYKSTIGDDDSVWGKTKSLFSEAITVREVNDNMEGNSIDAILARAEIYLKSGNISRVISELEQLSGKSAKHAKEWLNDAKKYRDIEKIFGDIYSRATDISADIFKIENAKSPIPELKPVDPETKKMEELQNKAEDIGNGSTNNMLNNTANGIYGSGNNNIYNGIDNLNSSNLSEE